MVSFEATILAIGGLLILSVLASKASGLLGIPSLLAFIGVGMLAGPDGPGGLSFNDPAVAQRFGTIALAFILFAGGMETEWKEIKGLVWPSISLSTVGVSVSAVIVGLASHYLLGFSILEGLLLGSILAATDAAAIFGLLRGRKIALRKDLQAIIELESGSNDPMAVFLTTAFTIALISEQFSFVQLIPKFFLEMTVGAVIGYVIGRLGVVAMRKLRLESAALYSVLSLSIVLMAFAGTVLLHGNGFLATYIAGVVYGQGVFAQKRGLQKFHDGLAWIMQIAMFLTLGLLVVPTALPTIAFEGICVSVVLIFVARPLAVYVSLLPYRLGKPAKMLLAWAGLRGAIPIVLATIPLLSGISRSGDIFNIVFFVVLASSLVQGTTLPALATRLGLRVGQQ